MLAPFSPTRPRSRAASRGRPIRTYVGTVSPVWQPQKTNWCHGLTAESDTSRLVPAFVGCLRAQRSLSFLHASLPPLRRSRPRLRCVRAARWRCPSLRRPRFVTMTLALTAMMTAISAVHWKAARALFRFRKSRRAGWHAFLANVKMPAAFGPTRPRTRATSCGRPICTYVGTV